MIKPTAKLLVNDKRWRRLVRDMEFASKKIVMVGIPRDAARPTPTITKGKRGGRKKRWSSINMATLAYIMENGSQINNIPPRPFFKQTWALYGSDIRARSKKLLALAMQGVDITDKLQKLANYYAGKIKDTMKNGTFTPNAPITVNGGWMRNKVSGKPFHVEGKGKNTPLIDHGNLRKSIKGFVKDK